ncbi:MAG: DUF805 domain-containing protein [Rhodospirillales bacterium]
MNGAFDWTKFLTSHEGRIGRYDYWVRFVLPYFVIIVVLSIVDGVSGMHGVIGGIGVLSGIFWLLMIYPSICVGIKRCHDRNKSGWWLLLALVPIIGAIWVLVELGCLRGDAGANRFGPDPLGA